MPISLKKIKKINFVTIDLPSSKSESNRALMINALAGGSNSVKNLSEARDTQTMRNLLASKEKVLDVIDAGTTMRFLTAFYSIINENRILTGTARMQERPIRILVEALQKLGASIKYLKTDGFPPIETISFEKQIEKSLLMPGNISSQYVSAILMISPRLPHGLNLELGGKITSKPYIRMTLDIMAHYGIKYHWEENLISVSYQNYNSEPFNVSPDWSGASYWYSLVALMDDAIVDLRGLKEKSYQGDQVIRLIMDNLGVKSQFLEEGVRLTKKSSVKEFSWDFSDCPDLAQTIAVISAAKGITFHMQGIESLRIKETDRIKALQQELSKIGGRLLESKPGQWTVIPSESFQFPDTLEISTYDDHRMAMAFAPLAAISNITIDNHAVVNKSYPGFWKDFEKAGIESMIF